MRSSVNYYILIYSPLGSCTRDVRSITMPLRFSGNTQREHPYPPDKSQNGRSPFRDYDPTPAIHLWVTSTTRRPNQRKRKSYKARESAKRGTVLIDCSSTEEDSNSDNEDELEEREKDDEQ